MTKYQILKAFREGFSVYWCNGDFKVILVNNELHTEYKHNDNVTKLKECELHLCFKD